MIASLRATGFRRCQVSGQLLGAMYPAQDLIRCLDSRNLVSKLIESDRQVTKVKLVEAAWRRNLLDLRLVGDEKIHRTSRHSKS